MVRTCWKEKLPLNVNSQFSNLFSETTNRCNKLPRVTFVCNTILQEISSLPKLGNETTQYFCSLFRWQELPPRQLNHPLFYQLLDVRYILFVFLNAVLSILKPLVFSVTFRGIVVLHNPLDFFTIFCSQGKKLCLLTTLISTVSLVGFLT